MSSPNTQPENKGSGLKGIVGFGLCTIFGVTSNLAYQDLGKYNLEKSDRITGALVTGAATTAGAVGGTIGGLALGGGVGGVVGLVGGAAVAFKYAHGKVTDVMVVTPAAKTAANNTIRR